MIYKRYVFSVILRILVLLGTLIALAFGIVQEHLYMIMIGGISSIITVYSLYRYVVRRFISIDDFFESVKYRDFSRWFSEDKAPRDLRDLHKGFNLVNATIKSINNERQAQFLYLQKILEMVDVGIIAYNVETGEVLWTNDSFLQTLDFPSFKNINFVSSRKPEVYDTLFETYHPTTTSVTLEMNQETFKVLVTDSIFQVEEHSFKLIVLQNIEETLNQNESDAWKKLLSVMTHEIMNSIAPISSLAETLQLHIQSSMSTPETAIDLDDLMSGITSIKKRSEGLMKFAKTYRTLNTITHVNRSKVNAQ
ncbi:MAG: nitrogen fixation/metabolism regulation signal transduction histidine kinase, partial [Dokdonia sp.]